MHKYSEMLNRITEKMKRGLEKRLTTAHEQFKNHSELKENKPFDTCFRLQRNVLLWELSKQGFGSDFKKAKEG